jgi:hypothetical protein
LAVDATQKNGTVLPSAANRPTSPRNQSICTSHPMPMEPRRPASSLAPASVAAALLWCACSVPEPRLLVPPAAPRPAAVTVATISDPSVVELSGLAVSRRNPGTFWVHNDSGDAPRAFAIDAGGRTVAVLALEGASAVDWEDLAIGPGPDGRSTLFVADVGDNARVRPSVTVYRAVEPLLGASSASVPAGLTVPADSLDLAYPDAPHDCEALLRDPLSSELYLVTKEDDGPAIVFAANAVGAPSGHDKAVMRRAGAVSFGALHASGPDLRVTAGDVSFDGMRVALRTQRFVVEWARTRGETVEAALGRGPARVLELRDDASEAIGYGPDAALYVSREGPRPPVLRIEPWTQSAGAW